MSKTNINAREVYDIVTGILTEEESRNYLEINEEREIPVRSLVKASLARRIKNEFSEGSECDKLYGEVYDAKIRLNKRLSEDENDDIETIINNMFDICRIVGCKMYKYGAEI